VPRRASGLPRRGGVVTDKAAREMIEAILDRWQPEEVPVGQSEPR
jgi:hypothetical protein